MERNRQKSLSRTIVFTIAFACLALFSAIVIVIFLQGIFISLKDGESIMGPGYTQDYNEAKLFSLRPPIVFENYINAFTDFAVEGSDYFAMFWHSIWRTTGASFISWFSTIMVCYVLVHYKSKFTSFVYMVGLVISIIPIYGAGPSQYKLYDELGLVNNPLILYTNISLFGGYFFYMYAFWKGISWSYAEAAEIDGANDYQIFFKIMLPMLVPSAVALFVMTYITGWNDYEGTLLFMKEYPNLAYGVYAFNAESDYGNRAVYFAGVLLSVIPILVLFLAFQNTIMEKVYLGGLKG